MYSYPRLRISTRGRRDSSIAMIDVSGIVCSRLCGRRRVDAPREVRLALFQEGSKRLFCVFRADLRTELFVLGLHRRLDLLPLSMSWSLGEFTASQASGRLPSPPTVRQAKPRVSSFTATVRQTLAFILNGTIVAGMAVLLIAGVKRDSPPMIRMPGKPDVCRVVGPKRHSTHDAAAG
jgi:hypothetical protein